MTEPHVYLSTACLHADERPELHDYCKAPTGRVGAKQPASCKWCQAPCQCPCHEEAPDEGDYLRL